MGILSGKAMQLFTRYFRRSRFAIVSLAAVIMLSGCWEPKTEAPFHFSALVEHTHAAGSQFTITQSITELVIEGTLDNDGRLITVIPKGTALNHPIQVSVFFPSETYKYLSDSVEMLEKMVINHRASKMARVEILSSSEQSNIEPKITLKTTAEFAKADHDRDGWLSVEEIHFKYIDSLNLDYIARVKDLMVAADIARRYPHRLFYPSTYHMMSEFEINQAVKSAFFATNTDLVQESRLSLFGQASEPNGETQSFLRLDEKGWPLSEQGGSYWNLPWSCVDDIRRVSVRNYAVRLWYGGIPENNRQPLSEINSVIREINARNVCLKSSWALPTINQLATLFSDGMVTFPNTFPFLTIDDAIWALNEQGQRVLVSFASDEPEIKSVIGNQEGMLLLHSIEMPDMWFNIPAKETPVDLVELREKYAQEPSLWPKPTIDEGIEWQELGLLPPVPFPADNPYSKHKENLGRKLFFDKRLSKDNTISCGSCHEPSKGWADGTRVAVGIEGHTGTRNTPTILNTAYYESLFWDGRVKSLEEQSLHPIANPIEMGLPLDELLVKLEKINTYRALFKSAFGDEGITLDRIAKSIATFERTIISRTNALDRFLIGDKHALNDQELHGMHLFRTKARCLNCHSGPLMTNNGFANIGLTFYGREFEDRGRYNVTFNAKDMGRFRVPALRDIEATDPMTHLGFFKLAIVPPSGDRVFGLLAMYNNGMTRNRSGNFPQYEHKYDVLFPKVSTLIERLGMTSSELLALKAFMSAISSDVRKDSATPEEMGIVIPD